MLAELDDRKFARRLDRLTAKLCAVLPDKSASLGFARKFLNIFLRDSLYDAHLSRTFRLARIEPWLEVPLDGDVGRHLLAEPEGASLPRWKTIYELRPRYAPRVPAGRQSRCRAQGHRAGPLGPAVLVGHAALVAPAATE